MCEHFSITQCYCDGRELQETHFTTDLFLQKQPRTPLELSTPLFCIFHNYVLDKLHLTNSVFMHSLSKNSTAIEGKLMKSFMLGSSPCMPLLHTRGMRATKQIFHYHWCWEQVSSVKAPGNFHKNKVILYWSHGENLLPLPPCSGILEASFSCTQADTSRDLVSCSRTHMQEWFMPMWFEPKNPAAPMWVAWIIQAVSHICKFAIWVTWFIEYMIIFTSSNCYTVYTPTTCILHHNTCYM